MLIHYLSSASWSNSTVRSAAIGVAFYLREMTIRSSISGGRSAYRNMAGRGQVGAPAKGSANYCTYYYVFDVVAAFILGLALQVKVGSCFFFWLGVDIP